MHLTTDQEILEAVKTAAAKFHMSALALVNLGCALAEWQKHALIAAEAPYPRVIDEAEITTEAFESWPQWVVELAPIGSKWERLHWPDGSVTIRLVTPRAFVLAAKHLPARATERA